MHSENQDLVIMACSAPKRAQASAALDLYQGVMYSTFRANVRPDAHPAVAILSAMYGVIAGDAVIEPYEQRLTPARADAIVADLDSYLKYGKPFAAKKVLLAGGAEYRRVMRAILPRLVENGSVAPDAVVSETTGGIGYQRQQLGQFLRACAPSPAIVGHHPNGNPLFHELEGFKVGQDVNIAYAALPGVPAVPAFIEELFYFRGDARASVRVLNAKNPKHAQRWVALKHINPADHSDFGRPATLTKEPDRV